MGGGSSTEKKKIAWPKDDFIDLVLSWSIKDIFDDTLYQHQVEQIPQSFESAEHYIGSFFFRLLEETRADIAASLKDIVKAPFAELISFDEVEPNGAFDVKVDYWRNKCSDGRVPYRTSPGDIVVISKAKPEAANDLQRSGYWTFASVIDANENDALVNFKVRIPPYSGIVKGMRQSCHIVFLVNVMPNNRVWDALRMRKNLSMIEKVLCPVPEKRIGQKCDVCSTSINDESVGAVACNLLSKLNESQASAILTSLATVKCRHKASVELICGPPGTGKTRTLSAMLVTLLRMKCRTITCAPTDVATARVASKLVQLVQETYKNEFDGFCPLGDILLFGNNNCEDGEDIEEISLDYRVGRLAECLAPMTGWNHCVSSMINFLEELSEQEEAPKVKDLQKSLGKLDFPTATRKDRIMEFCIQMASSVFSSASTSYKLHSVDMEPFDLLVVDDACQLKECEAVIPLQLRGLRHTVLAGGERQLSTLVKSRISREVGFGRSLFERLLSLGHSKHLLNVQYRMHPSISQFPNSIFYGKQILDAPDVKCKAYEKIYLKGQCFGPYTFINVPWGEEELDNLGHRRNLVEVALVMQIVQSLFKAWNTSNKKLSIGVISPYAAQVLAIQDRLGQKYNNHAHFEVNVKTVDRFQGGENDIVIISTVRSNRAGSIGFLSSLHWTNVALTRARHCLWILGNEQTMLDSNTIWEALVLDAKDRLCFFHADDDTDMRKTLLDVKKELDQLDDFLNGDSILFKKQRWKVVFSDNFRKSFRKLASSCLRKYVLTLLVKLASGWRPKRNKVELVCESSTQVVKQFKVVEGRYIVCTVDIQKEDFYTQVLKVWDILPLEEVAEFLKRLDAIYLMYTKEFINLCKEKYFEGDWEVPKSWEIHHEIVQYKNDTQRKLSGDSNGALNDVGCLEKSKVSESFLLMKFYSLSSGMVTHLLSDRYGEEVDIPFEVTNEEREIICFSKSSFILGRSGTGKTTVLTMKLFQKEQHYHSSVHGLSVAEGNEVSQSAGETRIRLFEENEEDQCLGETSKTTLHQLFVTVSPKLCYAVNKQVSQLKRFALGGSFWAESSFETDDLDGMTQFRDIPNSFIAVPYKKYPLVITFHKFLMMLDGTIGSSYFDRFNLKWKLSKDKSLRAVALETFIREKEISYGRFCCLYWPHFRSQLTKNLDPSRVFTEIMSHIKGGLHAGDFLDGKLSRDAYVSMSEHRVSNLSAEKREGIYDIFQTYEKMKMTRGEFDLSDLVNDLHLRLKCCHLDGDKMDFVYVDEVQDLTMRQISLFKYICRNVDKGFVFSGDTAQTIARGVDFRFEDIRNLFYTEFVMKSKGDARRKDKGHISSVFQLLQNFRTHTGVLQLAQSVINLLAHYFPQSVDVLKPETSLVAGAAPVLLKPGDDENAIKTIFGNKGNNSGKLVGFGAEQVILVRDESAKKEITSYVGQRALVLTIVECKGLEFEDVLMYNFFSSSPLGNQWRVVYEYMKVQSLADLSFPSFCDARHNIWCSELKQLYVAITRTRQRLWICESVDDFSRPMFDYWKMLSLVEVREVDDSIADTMQTFSTPDEWKSRGLKLFWEKNYKMALMCFKKAGETNWERRAKAASLRTTVEQIRYTDPEKARTCLLEAAEIFYSIGRFESAAECFYDLEDYQRAGNIYLHECGELLKAAECFLLAGRYKQAARVYAKGNYFTECLSACTKGKCYYLGLEYIEDWKQNALQHTNAGKTDEIGKEFLENCAYNFFELKDTASMMKFVKAFPSMDMKRKFLMSRKCLDELLLLEEESGNFADTMQTFSTPDEWKSRGLKLFWEKNYKMALMCFKKAGETNWERRAKAAGLRATVEQIRYTDPEKARTCLLEAAEIFYSIGRFESAAECFYDLEDYQRAGNIYLHNIYLHKCGELLKAAECFLLAGRYKQAARVYAKGNYFTECLSACTKGKCYYLGLEYIEDWKQNALQRTNAGKTDEIGKEFLENCAYNYFELKDTASMMKFVKSFPSMDMKRKFLMSRKCLDELLLLEEESGNFAEAAEIARLNGDILCEADLLGKGGDFNKACSLVLLYVLSHSLWMDGSEGWPLKSFVRKDELLKKATSFAKHGSNFETMCTEIKVLAGESGDWSDLKHTFSSSQKSKSFLGEMLCCRKILDFHIRVDVKKYVWDDKLLGNLHDLEELISCCQVGVGTLLHFWNLWKKNVIDVLDSIQCLGDVNYGEFKEIGEFCLKYFGARQQINGLNITYVLLHPAAEWVKNIQNFVIKRNKQMVFVDARHFISAARTHWHAELLVVGLKVLKTLASLYELAVKSMPLFCQSMCLLNVFEIAKFLLESEHHDGRIHNFLILSGKYFEKIFPLDPRQSMVDGMIVLRRTKLSCDVLQEFIVRDIGTSDLLSYGQIGRIVMIWLASGNLSEELYKKVVGRIPSDVPWKSFFETLNCMKQRQCMEDFESSDSVGGKLLKFQEVLSSDGNLECSEGSSNNAAETMEVTLLREFCDALQDTFSAHWMKIDDFFSPVCFLYLLERFLILVSQYRGIFFTAKSSFVEWLISEQFEARKTSTHAINTQHLEEFYDSVLVMVQGLIYDKASTVKWIERSRINVHLYYKQMVLRLVLILCLLCVNCEKYSDVLFKVLSIDDVRNHLPEEPYDILQRGMEINYVRINDFGEAFEKVGDPLLVVNVGEIEVEFSNVISVQLGTNCSREDILSLLLPADS
ncbi:uncharacterized protein LOC132617360 isoform X2 [Lycium barbarum]|uniref:uncharacterized protein LOC132617360 isoform X2 n=1 Tax=Lycium barbarum TaxID=112863 RepID=UPI00293F1E1B|nr:uncharacterized protein LOC132617360 isoform X2 [Lycium barbarum]